jgi:hypothetical protein
MINNKVKDPNERSIEDRYNQSAKLPRRIRNERIEGKLEKKCSRHGVVFE